MTEYKNSPGNKRRHRVLIVGGGISGLSAAHRLTELCRGQNHSLQIILLEAGASLGGVIDSQTKDGFLLESGPDSFITEKPWAVDLCRRLGLEGELIPTDKANRKSFIVRNGQMLPVPPGFYMMAPGRLSTLVRMPLVSWFGKLRMVWELFVPPRKEDGDESVASFVRRRFGQEALERLAQPMIGGIYSVDPEKLSLEATFPQFIEMERQSGSVLRSLISKSRSSNRGSNQSSLAYQQSGGPRYSLFASL